MIMAERKKTARLSKSKYVVGLQCLKRLYLQCYKPERAAETDEASQAIIDQGTEVGRLARACFPGGELVDYNYADHPKAVRKTEKLVRAGKFRAVFEAAFSCENINIRIDILEKLPRNRWHLIEVKSSTGIKDDHLHDIAIQKYVAEKCGLHVSRTSHMHINKDYVYGGRKLNVKKLFTVEDVTKEVTEIEKDMPAQLAEQWKVLKAKRAPRIKPGSHCGKPDDCEFYRYCCGDRHTAFDWIGNLPNMNGKKMDRLLESGIESIRDIPADYSLTAIQERAQTCVKKNRPCFAPGLVKSINRLKTPIYFMDFETANPAVPRYKKMSPYDHIPFQWSVHKLEKRTGRLSHYEFIHAEKNDPRERFIESLLAVLEKNRRAPILVYYQSFESGRLQDIARWFPQYAKRIEAVQKRLCDMWEIVKKDVYHPAFCGSFSIKKVLPALVKKMSYEGMTVANGMEAAVSYRKLTDNDLTPEERRERITALLEYCCQDTLAMVKLFGRLQKEARKLEASR